MHRASTARSNPPKLEMLWPKGQPNFYDQLMLECEENNLGRGLATSCQVLFQQGKPIIAVT